MSLVKSDKIEANKYEMEIAADAAQFEAAIAKAYNKAKNKISVNGFRKGKAPRKMIEKIYGENVFYEDACNELVPEVVAPAMEEADLELVDTPDIRVTSINKDTGVTFMVTAVVKPEVEISDYKGIEVTKTVAAVTDEDVDKMIESLRERNGRMITVEDRPAENGDIAVIDYEGFKDGVPFEGGKEDNYELVLGGGQFIPGFEEQIVGRETGSEFTINVTFPENYQMKELAGQPAEFRIKLHEIRAKELPELDDEFVKDATDFDTLDEVKADFRKRLEDNASHRAEIEADNSLYEALAAKMTADIPRVMIEHKIDEMVHDFEANLSRQGINLEIYLAYMSMDKDAFRKTFEERAEQEVKIRLALEKIAKLENVEIPDEKVDEEIDRLAELYKMTADRVRSYVSPAAIKADLAVAEAAKIVKDSAKIAG